MIFDAVHQLVSNKLPQRFVFSGVAFDWSVDKRRREGKETGSMSVKGSMVSDAAGVIEETYTTVTLDLSGACACTVKHRLPEGMPNPKEVLRIKRSMLDRARAQCTPT